MWVRIVVAVGVLLWLLWVFGLCPARIVGLLFFVIGAATAVFCRELAAVFREMMPSIGDRYPAFLYCLWGIVMAGKSAHMVIFCQW